MIEQYIKEIDTIYGTYLDSTIGYGILKSKFEALNPDRSKSLFIGKGNPNLPETYAMHSVRFDKFFERNKERGNNFRMMSNMVVSTIYQLWEDNYRIKIAESLGIEKNDLKSDSFGDLRIIRQAIIHNNGQAISDFKKLKVFKFLSKGEINISSDKIEIIINSLKTELKKIKEKLSNCA
jgi:hypothetical protein